jgi:uncharacterized protein Yka (UPF0111/DUF47 family)
MTDATRRLARTRQLLMDLTGRFARQTVEHVLVQIDAAVEGVELAETMARGRKPTMVARKSMSEIEHRGDAGRLRLVQALSRALTTPIDREDLYRLSRSVDDVLDNLRDFVRESDLYQAGSQRAMVEPLRAVGDGLLSLRVAVVAIVGAPEEVTEHALAARRHANRVRILYQARLGELFNGALTMEVLKTRELLRRIDVVALRLGEASGALIDGMLKRSL